MQIEDIEVGERRVTKGAYQESEGVPKSTIGASLRPPNTNSKLYVAFLKIKWIVSVMYYKM